jgi:hypothetical protein
LENEENLPQLLGYWKNEKRLYMSKGNSKMEELWLGNRFDMKLEDGGRRRRLPIRQIKKTGKGWKGRQTKVIEEIKKGCGNYLT